MTKNRLLGVLVRVTLSIIFAGIFYTGWMAIAIPTIKSGFDGPAVKAVIWIFAPILTSLGFSVGAKISELLPAINKTSFLETYEWCLAGCAIGAGIVWAFGPMLIVFGMFTAGTISVVLHEVVRIRKQAVNNKSL